MEEYQEKAENLERQLMEVKEQHGIKVRELEQTNRESKKDMDELLHSGTSKDSVDGYKKQIN